MNLRQAFSDFQSGKRKSKKYQTEVKKQEKEKKKSAKKIAESKSQKVTCPRCGGDGLEPGTEYACTLCLGKKKITGKQFNAHMRQKAKEDPPE